MNVSWVRLSASARWWAAGVLTAALAGMTAVRWLPLLEIATLGRPPLCTLKLLTGYPCLACRGTRAAFALAHGDLGRALQFNPLATVFLASILLGSTVAAVFGRLPNVSRMPRPWTTLGWCLLAVSLLGNWAYVIAAGG